MEKRLHYCRIAGWAGERHRRSAAEEVRYHRRCSSVVGLDMAAAVAAGLVASMVVGEKRFGAKRKDPAVEQVVEMAHAVIARNSRAFEESEEFATWRLEASATQARQVM